MFLFKILLLILLNISSSFCEIASCVCRSLCRSLSQAIAWVRDLLKSDRLWTNSLLLRDLLPKRSLDCKRSLNQAIDMRDLAEAIAWV